ncbi:MAG: hypothetical protein AAB898_01145, partial [Patescibacteria group bacterium]
TGVVGLVWSAIFLFQGLRAPFDVDYRGAEFLTQTERERKEIEEQKKRDTDGDGINDYDEQSIYRTSLYLADSDSDGFDDGQEIKSGNDPNCPSGQDCGRGVDASVNNPVVASDLSEPLPFEDAGFGQDISSEADIEALLSQLSNDDIRAALIAQGIDQATVDAMSDEELRVLFNTALKELSESGAIDAILKQNETQP